ncbi:hypothetical protein CEXT_267851 [Caerostris extrusa]|uniref:Uncharacterized protein n=1 Tax=Caerostris extrusa TaxID=172846 RepID=A0AAV4V2R2_CAEEX|nr:hypothetical protein CEXT_267851 [Caerostris extrusa]
MWNFLDLTYGEIDSMMVQVTHLQHCLQRVDSVSDALLVLLAAFQEASGPLLIFQAVAKTSGVFSSSDILKIIKIIFGFRKAEFLSFKLRRPVSKRFTAPNPDTDKSLFLPERLDKCINRKVLNWSPEEKEREQSPPCIRVLVHQYC